MFIQCFGSAQRSHANLHIVIFDCQPKDSQPVFIVNYQPADSQPMSAADYYPRISNPCACIDIVN